MKYTNIISVDTGSLQSGLVHLISGNIVYGAVLDNLEIEKYLTHSLSETGMPSAVVFEEIKPYRGFRFSLDIRDTVEWNGIFKKMVSREFGHPYFEIPRNTIRAWCYRTYPDVCIPRIQKIIDRKDKAARNWAAKQLEEKTKENNELTLADADALLKLQNRYRNNDGELKKESFHHIDDSVVAAVMKEHWKLPKFRNKHGIASHAWAALACCTTFLEHTLKQQELHGV